MFSMLRTRLPSDGVEIEMVGPPQFSTIRIVRGAKRGNLRRND